MSESAQFIICEKAGSWAAAIRWQQNARPLPLRETRTLIDARAMLFESPQSVAAFEVTLSNAEGVLRLILELRRALPQICSVVLLTEEAISLAQHFQECGAVLVVSSRRRLNRVVRLVERHLALQESSHVTTRERVWARLPWGP